MFIKRERYLAKIRSFYEVDLIKVLTGVRRCGKSVLLTQIEEELLAQNVPHDHIIRINFEDIQFEKIRTAEKLNQYVLEKNLRFRQVLYFSRRDPTRPPI